MKLANASSHVKKDPKTFFYHSGGPVKLRHGSLSVSGHLESIFRHCKVL